MAGVSAAAVARRRVSSPPRTTEPAVRCRQCRNWSGPGRPLTSVTRGGRADLGSHRVTDSGSRNSIASDAPHAGGAPLLGIWIVSQALKDPQSARSVQRSWESTRSDVPLSAGWLTGSHGDLATPEGCRAARVRRPSAAACSGGALRSAGRSLITRRGRSVAAPTATAERPQFLPRADTIKNPVSLRREAHLGRACR